MAVDEIDSGLCSVSEVADLVLLIKLLREPLNTAKESLGM